MKNAIILPLLVAGIVAGQGCGSNKIPTYPTRGIVRFSNGEPVRFGSVECYNSAHDLTARGRIDDTGSFVLGTFKPSDGAVAGLHDVIVTQILMPVATGSPPHPPGSHVNRRFSAYATSQMRIEVEAKRTNECSLTVD